MPCGMLLGMQTPEITEAQKREAIRDMLTKRYNGVIPVTDEMIDMVLDGLAQEGGTPPAPIDYSQYLITCEHTQGRKQCKMRFYYLPEHEAANRPRLCGHHHAEYMRYEMGQQGNPLWSVD
jgi:hypothetical protein